MESANERAARPIFSTDRDRRDAITQGEGGLKDRRSPAVAGDPVLIY